MHKILLYYLYTPIENPQEIAAWQRELCTSLNLMGRILIAPEGINGTVNGTLEAIDQYKQAMHAHQLFSTIDFKEESVSANCFPRLQITIKHSIVHFGATLKNPKPGTHLSPQDVHRLLEQKTDDLVILDARNNFESRIGKFTGALTPEINNFRDLPTYFEQNKKLFENKKVLMYCTGGIRCEPASAYLNQMNIAKEVMQLEGGIIAYTQQFPNGFFKGKNYVFDARVAVPITNDVLTTCDICNITCDDYTHCLRASCNKQFVCCNTCLATLENCCSIDCQNTLKIGAERARPRFKKVPAHSCTLPNH